MDNKNRAQPAPQAVEPLSEDVAHCVQSLRDRAAAWKGCQPGTYLYTIDNAHVDTKAADLIERLARERDEARHELAIAAIFLRRERTNNYVPMTNRPNARAEIDAWLERHAARQAKPKENTHESSLPR